MLVQRRHSQVRHPRSVSASAGPPETDGSRTRGVRRFSVGEPSWVRVDLPATTQGAGYADPDRAGVRQLLEAPNYVHLSTLRADGSPDKGSHAERCQRRIPARARTQVSTRTSPTTCLSPISRRSAPVALSRGYRRARSCAYLCRRLVSSSRRGFLLVDVSSGAFSDVVVDRAPAAAWRESGSADGGAGNSVRAGAQAYLGPRPGVGYPAGDMMVDGVLFPLGEALRPLSLWRPSTRAWRQRNAGSRPRCIGDMRRGAHGTFFSRGRERLVSEFSEGVIAAFE